MNRSTHTYAELEISPAAWQEIHDKLAAAGYQHAFMPGGAIDMHGIAVTKGPGVDDPVSAERARCAKIAAECEIDNHGEISAWIAAKIESGVGA
jgi:hypothetical protein